MRVRARRDVPAGRYFVRNAIVVLAVVCQLLAAHQVVAVYYFEFIEGVGEDNAYDLSIHYGVPDPVHGMVVEGTLSNVGMNTHDGFWASVFILPITFGGDVLSVSSQWTPSSIVDGDYTLYSFVATSSEAKLAPDEELDFMIGLSEDAPPDYASRPLVDSTYYHPAVIDQDAGHIEFTPKVADPVPEPAAALLWGSALLAHCGLLPGKRG
jgi:hypothetical protein